MPERAVPEERRSQLAEERTREAQERTREAQERAETLERLPVWGLPVREGVAPGVRARVAKTVGRRRTT